MSESTNEEVRIVGISGSLRKASFNTALLKILAEKSVSSINIQVVTLNDIPLYNEDLDTATGVPAVNALKLLISSCDGVLISTPEYNHGIPGVLKNALDWLSRPSSASCFKEKPVSIISASKAFTGGGARAVSAARGLDRNTGAAGNGTGGCRRERSSELREWALRGRARIGIYVDVPASTQGCGSPPPPGCCVTHESAE